MKEFIIGHVFDKDVIDKLCIPIIPERATSLFAKFIIGGREAHSNGRLLTSKRCVLVHSWGSTVFMFVCRFQDKDALGHHTDRLLAVTFLMILFWNHFVGFLLINLICIDMLVDMDLYTPVITERATSNCLQHSLLEAGRPIPMDAC